MINFLNRNIAAISMHMLDRVNDNFKG